MQNDQTYLLLFHINMKVNGKSFHGATRYLDTYIHLRSIAGNTLWFTEFRPVRLPASETIHLLLLQLFRHHTCCYLAGTFMSFTAGVLNSFRAGSLFIALTDTPSKFAFSKKHR